MSSRRLTPEVAVAARSMGYDWTAKDNLIRFVHRETGVVVWGSQMASEDGWQDLLRLLEQRRDAAHAARQPHIPKQWARN